MDGRISAGHARALLSLEDPNSLANRIVDDGLSVREVEQMVAAKNTAEGTRAKRNTDKDADIKRIERDLAEVLGVSVSINMRGEAGAISLKFNCIDQFDFIRKRLLD
jgi:ParB family chromosome partitioning protein